MSGEDDDPIKVINQKVDTLADDIEGLRMRATALPEAESRILARMNHHSSWAIHFSTVRMTIGTFFITVCVTLMGLKWDDPKLSIVLASAAIWAIGYRLFRAFTDYTYDQREKEIRELQRIRFKEEEKPKIPDRARDKPAGALRKLTWGFGLLSVIWAWMALPKEWKSVLAGKESPPGLVPAWHLEAVESLSDVLLIDLSHLPAGRIEFEILRDKQVTGLGGGQIDGDTGQVALFGVDPASKSSLFSAVVSEDSPRGGGIAFFHAEALGHFQLVIKDGHDWTKRATIAREVDGNGEIRGVLFPAEP